MDYAANWRGQQGARLPSGSSSAAHASFQLPTSETNPGAFPSQESAEDSDEDESKRTVRFSDLGIGRAVLGDDRRFVCVFFLREVDPDAAPTAILLSKRVAVLLLLLLRPSPSSQSKARRLSPAPTAPPSRPLARRTTATARPPLRSTPLSPNPRTRFALSPSAFVARRPSPTTPTHPRSAEDSRGGSASAPPMESPRKTSWKRGLGRSSTGAIACPSSRPSKSSLFARNPPR